jgi:putative sigma-54 modulation protein
MQVTFSGKSTHLTDRERDYADKKLQRLARYFNSARDAHVVHSIQRNQQIVEVMVDLDGVLLRAEERSQDFNASIDAVVDKLEKQVRRFKEKVKHHKGRADAPTFASVFAEAPEPVDGGSPDGAEAQPLVVRRKRFAIKPMTVDEASLQMEMLHHDFFAFMNAETQEVAILYRRRDGDYGLLELES